MNNSILPDNPFDLLSHYALRSRACALSAPQYAPVEQTWTGIGFSLGDTSFLASMEEIAEIVNLPDCTPVPRTKPFVLGVANVRGTVVPVIDLMLLFQRKIARVSRLRRILVIEYRDYFTALVVDDVLGMQHFPVKGFSANIPDHVDSCYKPYLIGCYHRPSEDEYELEQWPVFHIDSLLSDQSLEDLSLTTIAHESLGAD